MRKDYMDHYFELSQLCLIIIINVDILGYYRHCMCCGSILFLVKI